MCLSKSSDLSKLSFADNGDKMLLLSMKYKSDSFKELAVWMQNHYKDFTTKDDGSFSKHHVKMKALLETLSFLEDKFTEIDVALEKNNLTGIAESLESNFDFNVVEYRKNINNIQNLLGSKGVNL